MTLLLTRSRKIVLLVIKTIIQGLFLSFPTFRRDTTRLVPSPLGPPPPPPPRPRKYLRLRRPTREGNHPSIPGQGPTVTPTGIHTAFPTHLRSLRRDIGRHVSGRGRRLSVGRSLQLSRVQLCGSSRYGPCINREIFRTYLWSPVRSPLTSISVGLLTPK